MGAHTHKKANNSDRARREQLKRESKRQGNNIHGKGMKNPKPSKSASSGRPRCSSRFTYGLRQKRRGSHV